MLYYGNQLNNVSHETISRCTIGVTGRKEKHMRKAKLCMVSELKVGDRFIEYGYLQFVFDVIVSVRNKQTKEVETMEFSVVPTDIIDFFYSVQSMYPSQSNYEYLGIKSVSIRE